MSKSIKIEIDQNGEVNIDALGFQGNLCEKATKEIEQDLGLAKQLKRKPEYYRASVINEQKVNNK